VLDLEASDVLSFMGTPACKGEQPGSGFFTVVVDGGSGAVPTLFVVPALPLMAGAAAEADACLNCQISAALLEFSAPLAG